MKIKLKKAQKKTLLRLLLSAILLVSALIALHFLPEIPWWARLLAVLPAYLTAAYPVLLKAGSNIARGQIFDENFLMSIASIGALFLGEYVEAVAVMLLFGVGELFESVALGSARQSVKALAKLVPDTVRILRDDGRVEEIDASDAEIGDLIVVLPGERVALDGVILDGQAYTDCSALTGESEPVAFAEGDRISGGVIVLDRKLTVKATAIAENSGVARILEMVEGASTRKAKAESFITRFSLVYTPIVCLLAAILAFVCPLFFGGYRENFRVFAYRALEFLVVSCPCALVISVPLSFFGSIGAGARAGILFKSGEAIENLADLKTAVFDKTGTLTEGKFGIVSANPAENHTENELLRLAAAAEKGSTHPIAQAFANVSADVPATLSESELRGLGRIVTTDRGTILAGNEKLLQKYGISVPFAENPESDAFSRVLIALNDSFVGEILLSDRPKAEAKAVISDLNAMGVRSILLSGDREAIVVRTQKELSLDEAHGALAPEDKLRLLEGYLAENDGKLAFTGDGINDSPALARADVGIAMGMLGSDAAIEAADLVIVDDDLKKIPRAVKISRRGVRIAKENVAFALIVKITILILSAIGVPFANMWLAVFADVGVSVIAILNAMRTLKIPKNR